MTNNMPAVFGKFLEIWQEDVHGNMFGVDAKRFSYEELSNTPEILSLRGRRGPQDTFNGYVSAPKIEISVDSSNFPYFYRGITGQGYIRYGGLGCGSINCNIPDGARSPPMENLLKEYEQIDFLTTGHWGGNKNVYFSKNPLVAFSGDKSGPYATPDGMLFVVNPSGLQAEKTKLVEIDEIIVKKVPIKNVENVYLSEKNSKNVSEVSSFSSKLKTHNFSDEDLNRFRKEGLIEIVTETAKNPDKLFEKRYPSEEFVTEGIGFYKNWIEDSEKFLKSNAFNVLYSDKYRELLCCINIF